MDDYAEYLKELFADFGVVTVRRMFGGYGLFHAGLMFALVVDEVLYLKADAHTLADFRARDLPPFSYSKQGRQVKLSYYQAPDEMMDDPKAAAEWARSAFAAARRAHPG